MSRGSAPGPSAAETQASSAGAQACVGGRRSAATQSAGPPQPLAPRPQAATSSSLAPRPAQWLADARGVGNNAVPQIGQVSNLEHGGDLARDGRELVREIGLDLLSC